MGEQSTGNIITFYSYKGGTGRTMALANVACILAQRQARDSGKGVLMIDWDLEAPGLHRYFRNHLKGKFSTGRGDDPVADERGLIDMFHDLSEKTDNLLAQNESRPGNAEPSDLLENLALDSEELARRTLEEVRPEDYVIPTTIPSLHLLKAGRFDPNNSEKYAASVNTFSWESIFNRSPKLFHALADRLSDRYQYVLIDSRTGITDISGICTMLLPEKLVMVFTPNLQSLSGGLDAIRRAAEYRKNSHDVRPLVCFPLVSRVETTEDELREEWRVGNTGKSIRGYEPSFEALFNEIYGPGELELEPYFDEMLIPHIPKYAYGEDIAVLSEGSRDKYSITRAYEAFADKLTNSDSPWASDHLHSSPTRESYTRKREAFLTGIARGFKIASPFLAVGLVLLTGLLLLLVTYQFRQSQELNARVAQAEVERERAQEMERQASARLSELSSADTLRKLQDENKALNEQLSQATTARVQAEANARLANEKYAEASAAARQATDYRNRAEEQARKAAFYRAQYEQCKGKGAHDQ